ncbi:hypothetical protein GCM10009867_05810 [Pedococcus aerophilus]|uniref:Uncharacterized protein n=1 Tax=Pedococcus aerophilus TaxID=436356 RepID=A0ABN3UFA1_9MICO
MSDESARRLPKQGKTAETDVWKLLEQAEAAIGARDEPTAAYLVLVIRRLLPSHSAATRNDIVDRLENSGLAALDRRATEAMDRTLQVAAKSAPSPYARTRRYVPWWLSNRRSWEPPAGSPGLGKRR